METFPVDQVLFYMNDRVERAAYLQKQGMHTEANILLEDARNMAHLMDTDPTLLFTS